MCGKHNHHLYSSGRNQHVFTSTNHFSTHIALSPNMYDRMIHGTNIGFLLRNIISTNSSTIRVPCIAACTANFLSSNCEDLSLINLQILNSSQPDSHVAAY